MAWTSLSFAFGSLLTSTKMTQLYDNITALANGDSGAPTIQNSAIAEGAVRPVHYPAMTPGSYSIGVSMTGSISNTVYTKIAETRLMRPGNLTFYFSIPAPGATGYMKIYRNGSPVGSEHVATTGDISGYEVSSGWSANDFFQVYVRHTAPAAVTLSQGLIMVGSGSVIRDIVTVL